MSVDGVPCPRGRLPPREFNPLGARSCETAPPAIAEPGLDGSLDVNANPVGDGEMIAEELRLQR